MSMSTVCKGVGGLAVAYGGYHFFRINTQEARMKAVSLVLFGIAMLAFGYVLTENEGVFSQDLLENVIRRECVLGDIPDSKMSCMEGVDILSTRIPVGSTMEKLLQSLQGEMDFTSCRGFLPWNNRFYAPGTRSIEKINLSDMRRSLMWGFDPFRRFYFVQETISELFGAEAVAVHQMCPRNFEDFVAYQEEVGIDFSPS